MTFHIERRVRWDLIVVVVVPGAFALAAAVVVASSDGFAAEMALGCIPWSAGISLVFARLLRRSSEVIRLSAEGLELRKGTEVDYLRWGEVSRVTLGSSGFYWRMEVHRAGTEAVAIPIYLWYENTEGLVKSMADHLQHLGASAAAYRGERVPWYAYFGGVSRVSGMFLVGALLPLSFGAIESALIFGFIAAVLFVLLGLLALLVLPFQVKEVRLWDEEVEFKAFAWSSIRVRYRDIVGMEIETDTPRHSLRTHIPVIRLETQDGKHLWIPSDICREFIVCWYCIQDLWQRCDDRGPRSA